MIHLTEHTLPIFDLSISLDKLLFLSSTNHQSSRDSTFEYSYNHQFKMNARIGNAPLHAHDLIYYPKLAQQVRQLKTLEYHISINLNEFEGLKEQGLKPMINALNRLNTLLERDKSNKALLDAEVNNLIMLHGQNKAIPIYQGAKPYYSLSSYCRKPYATRGYQVRLSGLTYYFNLRSNRFKGMKSLYELKEQILFKPYLEQTPKESALLGYGHSIRFIGGIINTPILAFHIKKSHKHQGKRYYLDVYTHQVVTRLEELHQKAAFYAKNNYQIELIETIKK